MSQQSNNPQKNQQDTVNEYTVIDNYDNSSFKLPRHRDLDGMLSNNANDSIHFHKDIAEEVKKKDKRVLVTLLVCGIIVVAVIIALGVFYVSQQHEMNYTSTTTTSDTSKTSKAGDDGEPENYVAKQNLGLPLVSSSETVVTLANPPLKVMANQAVLSTNTPIDGDVSSCDIAKPTEFCFIGTTNDNKDSIFYFKDATATKIFTNIIDPKKVSIPGAPFAFATQMKLTDNDYLNALVIVNKDSSAWVVSSKDKIQVNNFKAQ